MTDRRGPASSRRALDRDLTAKDPGRIAAMFDAIAGRYDALNHVLSGGLDRRWRSRAVRELRLTGRETVLDLCTGTADLAVAAAGGVPGRAARVVGIDFAAEMLRLGARKVRAGPPRIALVRADATRVPLAAESVDAVTIAFGIRNVQDAGAACAEIHRVLRPGGRLAILEFGVPRARALRAVYLWYFERVLPLIGRLVSRHGQAYTYLPASVSEFPAPDLFVADLAAAGFAGVRAVPLSFGIVYLFSAVKPATTAGRSVP